MSSSVVGVFPIGDTTETFVIAEWHPDPAQIEADLLRMANLFDDWTVPMQEIRQIMIDNTRTRFEEENDPEGIRWVPLDPVYQIEKTKAGFPDEILVRTGALKSAATSEEAWFIDEHTLWFNAAALPDYGALHQTGTGAEGTTKFRRIERTAPIHPKTGLPQIEDPFYYSFELAGGRGNALPQRQFIGADEFAILEMEQVFLKHLDSTVTEEWDDIGGPIDLPGPGGGGVTQEMGTNVLGTFPVIGRTRHGVPILRTPFGPRFGRK